MRSLVQPAPAYAGLRGLSGACGDMPGVGERLTPDPRTRDTATGLKVVPTVWAQRGANAYHQRAGIAARLVVDGQAGRATLAALNAIRLRILGTYHPIPTDPSIVGAVTILDSGHVSMPAHMHDLFAQYNRVTDPAGSVAVCSWSATTGAGDHPTTTHHPLHPEMDDPNYVAPDGGDSSWSSMDAGDWRRMAAGGIGGLAVGIAIGTGLAYAFGPRRGKR